MSTLFSSAFSCNSSWLIVWLFRCTSSIFLNLSCSSGVNGYFKVAQIHRISRAMGIMANISLKAKMNPGDCSCWMVYIAPSTTFSVGGLYPARAMILAMIKAANAELSFLINVNKPEKLTAVFTPFCCASRHISIASSMLVVMGFSHSTWILASISSFIIGKCRWSWLLSGWLSRRVSGWFWPGDPAEPRMNYLLQGRIFEGLCTVP